MTEPSTSLEERVGALESLAAQLSQERARARAEARGWRRAALALGLATCGLGITLALLPARAEASPPPDELRARRFVLEDSEGRARIVMGPTSSGTGTCLTLYDAEGGIRLLMAEDEGIGSLMDFKDGEGRVRLRAEVDPERGGRVLIGDTDGSLLWSAPQ